MAEYTVVGIGELLWDVLDNSEKLGGAPINFAYHAKALGARAAIVSTVGDDRRGKKALLELSDKGLSTSAITTIKDAVTGYVRARLDDKGVASYEFPENTAWDNLQLNDAAKKLAPGLDAVCFGSLAQRSEVSRRKIREFLHQLPPSALKVFDLNLRQNFYQKSIIEESLQLADILKLNDDELEIISGLFELSGGTRARLDRLISLFHLDLIALTRGERGSLLIGPDKFSEHPGFRTKIVDTIGAGDSFTAVVTLGLLSGVELDSINNHANLAAAYVCSCQGAMPPMPADLRLFC